MRSLTTKKRVVKLPAIGTTVETTDEYGNTDRGIYRGIMPGRANGSTVRDRQPKAVIDGGGVVAHIPVDSLRNVKRIPAGMVTRRG